MSAVIAKGDLGPCCGCGINIERGEWAMPYVDGPTHVGCTPRPKLEQVGTKKKASSPQSGYLFGDAETAIIEHTQEVLGVNRISFDGASVLQLDTPRLAGQLARVFELMRDGKFRTLAQIAAAAGCLETSASARLRDCRKTRFGGHAVLSRLVSVSPVLYEYRLIINERKEVDGQRSAA